MESSNREEMSKSLLDWFTVLYDVNCLSHDQSEKIYLNDLTDGVAMAIALKNLAPDYFTGEVMHNFLYSFIFVVVLNNLKWCKTLILIFY